MSTRTFSRRGKAEALQPSPAETQPAGPLDHLLASSPHSPDACTDPLSPFFFGSGEAEDPDPAKSKGRASGGSGRAGAAAGKPHRPSGGRAGSTAASPAQQKQSAAGRKSSCKAAAASGAGPVAITGRTTQQQQQAVAARGKAKPRPAVKPAASPLLHRSSGGNTRARQHRDQAAAAATSPAEAVQGSAQRTTGRRSLGGGKPSVRSRPAPEAAAQQQQLPAVPAGKAGGSPGKRKAPVAPAPAADERELEPSPGRSPSKKMKKGGSASGAEPATSAAAALAASAAPAAAAAAAAPARAPSRTAGASGGGASRRGAQAAGPPAPAPAAAAGAAGTAAGRGGGLGGMQMAALTRLLRPAALREQAAATTVVQAQALGEQQSITDDALWALDGLASGSDTTARESLAALAEICATRRGRLALRSGNIAADVLAAAGTLQVQQDPVQALGLATLLLCFCQADADAALLGRREVAAAAALLLKLSGSLEVGTGDGPAAARLLVVLRERPYSAQVQAEERGSPLALALVALAGCLNPHDTAINADPLKRALREAGALEAAAQVAAEHAAALADASPTIQTVRHLWRLHKALLVLENVCFACPDNEARLLAVTVQTGLPPLVATTGLVGWLVAQLALLARQALITGVKKDCLRALLAVLMNLTQSNAAGCAAVVAAGALGAVARVLAQLVRGGPKIRGVAASRQELGEWSDELSYCLMLLTNLVEQEPSRRQQLRLLQLPDVAGGGGGSGGAPLHVVPLLCALLAAVAPRARAEASAGTPTAAAAAAGGGLAKRLGLGSGEVTVDCLETSDAGGHASIAEAYAAILLGFLIQDCGEARRQAAALLGGSLDSVAAAVAACLHFYVTTGAMTKSNEASLRALLASLQQPLEGAGGVAGAGMEEEGQALSPVLD